VKAILPVAAIPLLLIAFSEVVAQDQNSGAILTVSTDKDGYTAGETIVVSGTVARIVEGERLLFRLYNPLGALARADPVEVSDNGTYRYQFPSVGPIMAQAGEYRVVVNYDFQEAETFFDFSAGSGPHPWTIAIDGQPYQIRFQILGGRISSMSGDPESKSITVTINTTRDGVLRLQFRSDIIKAQNATNGQDVPFIVLIDGVGSNYTEFMNPAPGTRELEIPFAQGQSKVEIIGTWVVPELHAMTALTLGAAILGILIARQIRTSYHAVSQSLDSF